MNFSFSTFVTDDHHVDADIPPIAVGERLAEHLVVAPDTGVEVEMGNCCKNQGFQSRLAVHDVSTIASLWVGIEDGIAQKENLSVRLHLKLRGKVEHFVVKAVEQHTVVCCYPVFDEVDEMGIVGRPHSVASTTAREGLLDDERHSGRKCDIADGADKAHFAAYPLVGLQQGFFLQKIVKVVGSKSTMGKTAPQGEFCIGRHRRHADSSLA